MSVRRTILASCLLAAAFLSACARRNAITEEPLATAPADAVVLEVENHRIDGKVTRLGNCARLVGCNVRLTGAVLPLSSLTVLLRPRAEAHLTIFNLQHQAKFGDTLRSEFRSFHRYAHRMYRTV